MRQTFMSEKLISGLENALISLGEDNTFLKELKQTYLTEYGKIDGAKKYLSHLQEIEKKYYGEMK